MGRQLRVERPPIRNISDLRDRCLNVWYNLSPVTYQGLVSIGKVKRVTDLTCIHPAIWRLNCVIMIQTIETTPLSYPSSRQVYMSSLTHKSSQTHI
ncbi:hypothetical protein NPIL_238991 [Nephila pilipes]|uniref:Uncharacterized protein n=1 Tax=Nephila pilipes TaxID=299642 RepID=A0A8X6UNZ6_NEPPI|nr:hypothetical protein NPIL_238991 [Nephila pilipes]